MDRKFEAVEAVDLIANDAEARDLRRHTSTVAPDIENHSLPHFHLPKASGHLN